MKIGFTGTHVGMTAPQIATFSNIIKIIDEGINAINIDAVHEFHHGDCIGADAIAHEIVSKQSLYHDIVIHPPLDNKKRAFCAIGIDDVVLPPKSYLERNRDIVDECTILIATPKGFKEELRSGTWATIRYAQKRRKPVLIIQPDGNLAPDSKESFLVNCIKASAKRHR